MDATEGTSTESETSSENIEILRDTLYTPLTEALEEVARRYNNTELRNRVEKYLNGVLPPHLLKEPHAVLARQVITPNYEIIRFLNVPDSTGLPPLFLEYSHDKLIYKNPFKYYLGKLLFTMGAGKKGGMKSEALPVIPFDTSHGKPFHEVQTLWGEALIAFHHALFTEKYPQYEEALYDASEWYKTHGGDPTSYYKRFLALFICHGILFENFLTDSREFEFTRDVVIPAFLEVQQEFGLKPLIVALAPTEIEEDTFWYSHPYATKEWVSARMKI